jgi:hypothetical protein
LIVSAASTRWGAENISAMSTTRDGPPFNGAVFLNTTFQVNVTFKDAVPVVSNLNITMRIWDSPAKNVLRFEFKNMTIWPFDPSATGVRIYNTTVFINGSGIFIGNLTGTEGESW